MGISAEDIAMIEEFNEAILGNKAPTISKVSQDKIEDIVYDMFKNQPIDVLQELENIIKLNHLKKQLLSRIICVAKHRIQDFSYFSQSLKPGFSTDFFEK